MNWIDILRVTADRRNQFWYISEMLPADRFLIGLMDITLKDGTVVTVYSNYSEADHSRSIAQVANAVLADPDNGLTAAQLAQVMAYANAAN